MAYREVPISVRGKLLASETGTIVLLATILNLICSGTGPSSRKEHIGISRYVESIRRNESFLLGAARRGFLHYVMPRNECGTVLPHNNVK